MDFLDGDVVPHCHLIQHVYAVVEEERDEKLNVDLYPSLTT